MADVPSVQAVKDYALRKIPPSGVGVGVYTTMTDNTNSVATVDTTATAISNSPSGVTRFPTTNAVKDYFVPSSSTASVVYANSQTGEVGTRNLVGDSGGVSAADGSIPTSAAVVDYVNTSLATKQDTITTLTLSHGGTGATGQVAKFPVTDTDGFVGKTSSTGTAIDKWYQASQVKSYCNDGMLSEADAATTYVPLTAVSGDYDTATSSQLLTKAAMVEAIDDAVPTVPSFPLSVANGGTGAANRTSLGASTITDNTILIASSQYSTSGIMNAQVEVGNLLEYMRVCNMVLDSHTLSTSITGSLITAGNKYIANTYYRSSPVVIGVINSVTMADSSAVPTNMSFRVEPNIPATVYLSSGSVSHSYSFSITIQNTSSSTNLPIGDCTVNYTVYCLPVVN